jgi:transcriptional regulator with XRE-family HTH domain
VKQPEIVTTAELGRLLRAMRDRRGLSLRDVSDETGISASTLSRCENAEQYGEMDAHNIAKLAGYLDIPLERINAERFVYFDREPMPQVVTALLGTDRKLTPAVRDSFVSHLRGCLFNTGREEMTNNTRATRDQYTTQGAARLMDRYLRPLIGREHLMPRQLSGRRWPRMGVTADTAPEWTRYHEHLDHCPECVDVTALCDIGKLFWRKLTWPTLR